MSVYLKKGNWFIDYYANGKRKREKIGTSKTLAETVLKKRKVQIAENKFLDIDKAEKIRFDDFCEEFINLYLKPNNSSWKKSDLHNINRLKKLFSGKYLYEITPLEAEKFKAERSKEVGPSTTNRGLSCLRSMFNRAIAWGKFKGKNPVKGVRFLKEPPGRLRFLEKEEILKLLTNCNDYLKPIVIIALNTGMRRGEIFNLKWHDVDFRRGIISLHKTKNNERRDIPMNDIVRDTLIGVIKDPDSPYIFHNDIGKPYYNLRKSFFTACKKSGITSFRFHDLRHTFASQLVMSGVDLNTVRELLGHKSLEMTLRYSHLSPDHKKRAVDNLAKRMDTFWTLNTTEQKQEQNKDSVTIDKSLSSEIRACSSIG